MPRNTLKCAFIFLVCAIIVFANPCFVMETFSLPKYVTVKGTSVNIRTGPSTSYSRIGIAQLGYKIYPIAEHKDKMYADKKWYSFSYNGQTGYIRTDFTKEAVPYTYDANFEAALSRENFPESYKEGLRDLHAEYPNWIFTLHNTNLDFNYVVSNELVGGKTLTNATNISSYKSTKDGNFDFTTSTYKKYDGDAWVAASEEVTKAYMDPRNFLATPYVFQFEKQTFNKDVHSIEGIKEMVKGTFLDAKITTEGLKSNLESLTPSESANHIYGTTATVDTNGIPMLMADSIVEALTGTVVIGGPGSNIESTGPAGIYSQAVTSGRGASYGETSYNFTYKPAGTYSYAELIYDACSQVNANPYVVTSMILQEVGKNGSESVSGTNKKYKGFYNFGNINAFAGGGLTAIENGLKYASTEGSYNRPWNSKEKGIYGLCDFYANSYVNLGQDTFYLKKWNVQGENMFNHQYMTNVAGAAREGQILGNAYDLKLLSMPHEFKIPYYQNMEATPYQMPTKDGSPNNKLKSLSVSGTYLSPEFNMDTNYYEATIEDGIDQVYISAEVYDNRSKLGGIGNVITNSSNTNAIIYVIAENGDINQYNINIHKRGVTNNNISPAMIVSPNNSVSIIYQNNNSNINNNGAIVIGRGPGE